MPTKEIAELVKRLVELEIPDDKEIIQTVQTTIGALYSLGKAKQLNYEYYNVDSERLLELISKLNKDSLDQDNQWSAGYYFNSALIRMAAGYHRSLKLIAFGLGSDLMDLEWKLIKNLIPLVKQAGVNKDKVKMLTKVNSEVNRFKHDQSGTKERKVDFITAIQAADELIDLNKKAIAYYNSRVQ
ncbi:MAG: hypothetical protein ACM3UZ_09595 [Acidobacteriota bacterium]